MNKDKKNIKSHDHSCNQCDCKDDHCEVREVEIKNQSGLTSDENMSIDSYNNLENNEREE